MNLKNVPIAVPQNVSAIAARHQHHLMARLLQAPGCFNRHILIQQEFHPFKSVVWSATNGSISSR